MGKDEKEDSGFGFKDRAKAEETLRLLESHEMGYRRLTVRGLLGRAKRTLSLTKAEDKIKNIKEAMEVFENWLAEIDKDKKNGNNKEKKEKKDKEDKKEDADEEMEVDSKEKKPEKTEPPADKVQGLGFKDKEAAEATIRELEGRDPEYQRLAVKGLLGSAKRVLTCTRDETKLANIKEAMGILEKFLDDFETNHLSKQNNPYLSLDIVKACLQRGNSHATEQQKAFIAAYESVGGEYKRLRTVAASEGGKTWDIVRNTALKELKEKYSDIALFTDSENPTPEHLELLLWAYSPDATQTKRLIHIHTNTNNATDGGDAPRESRKRRSSGADHSPSKKAKDE